MTVWRHVEVGGITGILVNRGTSTIPVYTMVHCEYTGILRYF
jgi:hypothetical protein